jgi:hypothetical protein
MIMLKKTALCLSSWFLAALCVAQPAAPGAGRELSDMTSFFNGGFPHASEKGSHPNQCAKQIPAIEQEMTCKD